MKHQFSIQTPRAKYLIDEMGDRLEIVTQDPEWTRVQITINSGLDLLQVYHAGCKTGLEAGMAIN
jgi:hypothetical protein